MRFWRFYIIKTLTARFHYQRQLEGELANFSVANLFGNIAGTSFAYNTPLDTDIDVVLSIFSFGLPLNGYTTANDDTEDQEEYVLLLCFFFQQ